MVVYNVTVNIDADAHDEWLQWMVEEHIPDVLSTGLFLESRISKLQVEEEMGGTTYSIQYTLESKEKLEEYQENHAPDLQKKHADKFDGKFVAFRTIMEIVKQF